MRAVLHDDILEFPSQKVFDQRLVVGLHFNEVRQDAKRRPILAANGIEELLHRFRAVRALNRQLADGLKPVANALFAGLRFGRGFHRGVVAELVLRMRLFGFSQPLLQPAETGLPARVLFSGRNPLPVEIRSQIPRFDFFPLDPGDLRRDTRKSVLPAQYFVPDLRLTPHGLELLLPETFDRSFLGAPALRYILMGGACFSDALFDRRPLQVDG
ncbi:MAG: hypothetical protein HYU27_09480, partial [Acidobacteria bacterium]|nr:hypothetical protein [Acidobacteriota bacterium]